MVIYVPGTEETDPKKQNMSLQQIGAAASTLQTSVAALTGATYVNSIATRTGAITLNTTSGITNSSNDIILSQASSSQFGAVKVDNTTITAAAGVISAVAITSNKITASLGADVLTNNTANYFDGPSVAQGTTGTWFVSGAVTVLDTGAGRNFNCKLWDGTTVIASATVSTAAAGFSDTVMLSGFITSPAGNLRISVNEPSGTLGKIQFNQSGNSKDSTITAIRIA